MGEPTLNLEELTAALEQWDAEAAANQWPNRTDPERFSDNAKYLFGLAGKPV
jgi:hypothetical protein